MKSFLLTCFLIATVLVACGEESAKDPTTGSGTTADVVYLNGKIYTVNEKQPWAEAVAIKGGKFIKVGSAADIEAVTGKNTKVVDLGGKFVMPGIHDCHVHPPLVYTYEEAGELLFPESKSPDEVIKLVKDYATAHPELKIVRGQKWATASFPDGKATKEWLDPHFPDRAVYLIDETGHNGVLNSAALKLAGITKDTPDPEFGIIDRDPKTGEPTGYLSEKAMILIGKLVKRPDVDANYRGISRALDQIRAYGTTSIVDMMVGPNALATYQRLEKEGKLRMRVDCSVILNDYQAELTTEEESEALLARRSEFDSPLIDVGIKLFADGTPLSKTALLVDPYTSDPSTRGQMTIGERQFERIKQAHRDGIQVRMHATADGTTRKLLDVIEEARAKDPMPGLRHQIGHLMLVTKKDIPRFKQLNVIAEFSPVLWYPTGLGGLAGSMVGAERYARWMPIKEFVDAGATVVFGSDWPAGTPDADPWRGMEAMLTRMDPKTNTGDKLGEGIDLATAMRIFTINGAMAMMHEDKTGSIEVGKLADFIVLNQNLFDLEREGRVDRISETHALQTIFEGQVVYDREAAIGALEVFDIEITNKDLRGAVEAAELDLLVHDQQWGGACACVSGARHMRIPPGASRAPALVTQAFASLSRRGYRFARPARTVHWKPDDSTYWVQWVLEDDGAALWAYDPVAKEAVEVLKVREK